jgi:hypothetical protein
MSPHPFRAAVERRDLNAMVEQLAPDVVFHSPVVFRPYEGRDQVSVLLGAVVEVLEDFRYTDEVSDGGTTVLIFEARVGDREVQGMDLVRMNAAGAIEDFTVMIRPLSAALAVRDAMAERLGVSS